MKCKKTAVKKHCTRAYIKIIWYEMHPYFLLHLFLLGSSYQLNDVG